MPNWWFTLQLSCKRLTIGVLLHALSPRVWKLDNLRAFLVVVCHVVDTIALLDSAFFGKAAPIPPNHAHFFPTQTCVLDRHAEELVFVLLVVGSESVLVEQDQFRVIPRTLSRNREAPF